MTATPPGWATDSLTSFFDGARQHAFGTFFNLQPEYSRIRDVDSAFAGLIDGWMDPENPFVAPLAVRALSAFRAAAQLCLSGQLPEAYMVMRGCLEFALYGNYIDSTPTAWKIWSGRGADEAARKLCVRTFSGKNLFDTLRARDAQLGEIAGALYERAIEFGAHPNEMAVGSTMEMTEGRDGGLTFAYSFMSGDGMPLRLCIKSLTQTGLIVLDIFALVFPKRSTAAGVQEAIAPIKVHV